jgi:hypothetical protein
MTAAATVEHREDRTNPFPDMNANRASAPSSKRGSEPTNQAKQAELATLGDRG